MKYKDLFCVKIIRKYNYNTNVIEVTHEIVKGCYTHITKNNNLTLTSKNYHTFELRINKEYLNKIFISKYDNFNANNLYTLSDITLECFTTDNPNEVLEKLKKVYINIMNYMFIEPYPNEKYIFNINRTYDKDYWNEPLNDYITNNRILKYDLNEKIK